MRVKGGNTQKVMPEMKLKTENKSQRQKNGKKKEKTNQIKINVASQGIKVKSTTLSNSQMQQPLS